MELRSKTGCSQKGISLAGFIFIIGILALIGVLGMKVMPTVIEYSAIKKAIGIAKAAGTTPNEIRASFAKQAEVNYIESISGSDLQLVPTANGTEVAVAYEKKIGLIGPVSLVIDYEASTGKIPPKKSQ